MRRHFLGHALSALTQFQIGLEYDQTRAGLLVPREDSKERNLCSLYLHGDGVDAYFRTDVSEDVQTTIGVMTEAELLAAPELLLTLLGGETASRYETYIALSPFPESAFPAVRADADRLVIAGPGGQPASWAWSVREDERAAELAVETDAAFRHRGYATQVSAAWVTRTLIADKVPFYSHSPENSGSAALAARLGLEHVFTVLGVE